MSRIKTYEDLEAEEKRLQALLYSHKESVKDSFASFKTSLTPWRLAMSTVGKIFHTDSTANPLMKFGLDIGVDVLVRRILLAKSGWFTKIIVPFIIKNYSTHVVKQNKVAGIINKIKSFFTDAKKDVKEKAHDIKEDIKDTAADIKDSIKDTTADAQQSISNMI